MKDSHRFHKSSAVSIDIVVKREMRCGKMRNRSRSCLDFPFELWILCVCNTSSDSDPSAAFELTFLCATERKISDFSVSVLSNAV